MDTKQVAGAVAAVALSFAAGRISAGTLSAEGHRVHAVDVRSRLERLEDGGFETTYSQMAYASARKADGGWSDIGQAARCGAPNAECSERLLQEAAKSCAWEK